MNTPRAAMTAALLGICASVALAGHQDGTAKAVCLPLAKLDAKIRYCTDNALAEASAEACANQVMNSWEAATNQVAVAIQTDSGGQAGQLDVSQDKYVQALSRLDSLLEETIQEANKVAQYPTVMVDGPGVQNESESLPCFRDSFARIQQVVALLDTKAAEARAAARRTSALRERSGSSTQKIGRSTAAQSKKIQNPQPYQAAAAPFDPGPTKSQHHPSSSITGKITPQHPD